MRGWDPELGVQYYRYSFTGGDGSILERQRELAAIQLGQAQCDGQDPSSVASCIQQVYDQHATQTNPPKEGGNYHFNYENIIINGEPVDPSSFSLSNGCLFSRCGLISSLDFSHHDGTFHVDTANGWFFPIGTIVHVFVDVLGGYTWWRGGIPRFP